VEKTPTTETADPALLSAASKRTPAEAAARIRERRPLHPLPLGMSIRDLQVFGRR
jgi:hypothetical protein